MSEQPEARKAESTLLIGNVLFWPARILALLVIAICPWYYGAVSWSSQSFFIPLVFVVFLLAIAGAALHRIRFDNPLIWSLTALLALVLLQTVTLPNWLWQTVSAGATFEHRADQVVDQLKSSLTAEGEIAVEKQSRTEIRSVPRTLSINWVQSRASGATFAMAIAWLISTIILFRTAGWETVLVAVTAVTVLAVAVLGLLQAVAWNNWTLLPMPSETHFATFVSRNSGPQFLAVGLGSVLGLLIWWSHSKKDNIDKKYYVRYPAVNALARLRRRLDDLVIDLDVLSIICIFAATFIFVAILATASRGGILASLAAAAVTLGFAIGIKQGLFRSAGLIIIVACSTLILLTTLDLDDSIMERLDSVNQEAYMLNNGRIDVWRMILTEPAFWLPGCGLGNFHFAILPTYQAPAAWFYHAENFYIELLTELGLLGFAIGVAGVCWLLSRIRWCAMKNRLTAPSFIASIFALTAIGLQSLVDFSLIIPGVFLPFVALIGCFLGRSSASDFGKQTQSSRQKSRKRLTSGSKPADAKIDKTTAIRSVAIVATVLLALGVGYGPLRGHAFAEQVAAELFKQEVAINSDIDDETKVEQLLRTIDPRKVAGFAYHPEVNVQVGRALQRYFEKSLIQKIASQENVSQLSDAERRALASPEIVAASFRSSREDRVALKQFVEKNPQQLEALTQSFDHFALASGVCNWDWRPSWGLLRSDLSSMTSDSKNRNYADLSLVTFHDPTLPSQIVGAALLADENSAALVLLQRYLERMPQQTKLLVAPLLGLLTPSELEQALPKSQLLRADLARDLKSTRPEFSKLLVEEIDINVIRAEAERANEVVRKAQPWMVVAWVAEESEDSESELAALRQAVAAEPMRHDVRYELAVRLEKTGHLQESIEQAKRAHRQSPQNPEYKLLVDKLEGK